MNVVTIIGVVAAYALVFMAAICLFAEKGIHPFRRLRRKFAKLPFFAKLLVMGFGVTLFVHGSLKSPTNDPPRSVPVVQQITQGNVDQGFVLAGMSANVAPSVFDPQFHPGAVTNIPWLLRGAHEDWFAATAETNAPWAFQFGTNLAESVVVHSCGSVELAGLPSPCPPQLWPFKAPLGIVPEANWGILNSQFSILNSQFWHAATPSNTLILTWRSALLERDTNMPVSVQAELWPNGRFTYRYDLTGAKGKAQSGELGYDSLTNIIMGARLKDSPLQFTLADLLDNSQFSIFNSQFSISFHPVSAEDLANPDRDGDGLSLLDELRVHHTDPELWDTDADGVSDGAEVAAGMDPLARDTDSDGFLDGTDFNPLAADSWTDSDGDGFPDVWKDGWFGPEAVVAMSADANTNGFSNIASLLVGLNPVAPPPDGFVCARGDSAGHVSAWEISPAAFSFVRTDGLTNIVSRTFAVNRVSPWEQFFVSARPDGAAGWEMSDTALLYGVDGGPATNAAPSSAPDSWRVPLGDGMPQTITFRIEASGTSPRLSAPLYLLRWTPRVEFLPSLNVAVVHGTNGHVYAAARRNPETGAYEAPFRTDTSKIPHAAGIGVDVAADLALPPVAGVGVSNGVTRAFVAVDPLMADLPPEGTNLPARLLFYSVDFERTGAVSSGPRASRYSSPYPLTSSSLRKSFHAATGVVADGGVKVSLSPNVPDLGYVSVPATSVRGGVRLRGSEPVSPPVEINPTAGGEAVTNDPYKIDFEYPEDHDETPEEDDESDGDDDDDCECRDDGGASLGSFRIRIPFGESAADERLGYLWAAVDGPAAIAPTTFGVLAAQGVSVTTNLDGTLSIVCSANGGKALLVTNIAYGVAIPVWNASGRFESQWEVWNEGGDESRVRVRRTTVLGNATVDETYATWEDYLPMVFGEAKAPAIAWEMDDNISGMTRTRWEWRDADEPEFVNEEYEETRLGEDVVRAELRTYAKIGAGAAARRRLAHVFGYDESGWHETARTYWCDTAHPDRHARLKSVRSTRSAWSWHDYDACGREIVRIEQLDGAPFPELAEVSPDASLPSGCSAKITVTDYTPQEGDSAHRNESFEPREVSAYIRHGCDAPVLISHETRLYTREEDVAGNPLRRIVKAVGAGDAVRTETTVEYPQDAAVPSHLRGWRTLETAADGTETETAYALSNGCLVATSRRFRSPSPVLRSPFPTYTRTVYDAAYRLPLREETRLASNDALLEWSERAYDDIRRLRSVVYSDGTSETNAYSCCRLLWSSDRQGRRTLRSAQTGTDHLYYALEDVWLGEVGNGFKVTQHFFDALGRETNTVTYAGTIPGGAVVATEGTRSVASATTTSYPGPGSDYSISTDERGAVTERYTYRHEEYEESNEYVYTNDVFVVSTRTTRRRNGSTEIYRSWPDVNLGMWPWSKETRSTSYAPDGRRVETVVAESSDYGAVTNSVTTYDLLGRVATSAVPGANGAWLVTSNTYDGATTRILASTLHVPGLQPRTTQHLYNDFGEQVGTILDDVTERTDTTYETDSSNVAWKVETSVVVGPDTNSLRIVRTQLSGLSDACRRHTVELVGRSPRDRRTESTTVFDPATGIETETITSSTDSTVVRRSMHGLVLSTGSDGETTVNAYDAFGRVAATGRAASLAAPIGTTNVSPVESFTYAPCGDLLAAHTYTNAADCVTETYAYDMLGNRVSTTDAHGNSVFKFYDPFGNVTAEWGATYPVRYAYDTQNRRTTLSTTRDGATWDTTTWTYEPRTGLCTSKTYADGSTVSYTYTPDNLPLRTTYASGRWRENVYDATRRLTGVIYSSSEMNREIQNDAYGNATNVQDAAGNEWRYEYGFDSALVGEERIDAGGPRSVAATNVVVHAYDPCNRPSGHALAIDGASRGGVGYEYDPDGHFAHISATNAAGRSFAVAYTNAAGLNYGYTITTPGGDTIRRVVERDQFRRSLVTNCATFFNAATVDSNAYSFDALLRPVERTSSRTGGPPVHSAFAYNERSEVLSAAIGTNIFAHAYDCIGNHTLHAANGVTNVYEHNSLNQYAAVFDPAEPMTTQYALEYDIDGGMATDWEWDFEYDAADRLSSVSPTFLEDGALRVLNEYDYRNRRIRKIVQQLTITLPPPPSPPIETHTWNTIETRTFVYDDWNLIHETILEFDGGTTNITEVQYCWGLDLSDSLQGAGGVGGLLAVSRNGQFYFPTYDNNGNVTKYIDESGNVVAAYEYDDFGRLISRSGPLADFFRHRFSTKYYDPETGLYYYGERFYSPYWRIWLNRDPIEEEGGVNLYMSGGNNCLSNIDSLGQDWFNCFGDCVEEWRLNWSELFCYVNMPLAFATKTPKVGKERLWIKKGNSEHTTPVSRAILRAQQLALKLPNGSVRKILINSLRNLRHFMRNPALVGAGSVMAPLTVFEGAYDAGVMLYCSIHCCGDN